MDCTDLKSFNQDMTWSLKPILKVSYALQVTRVRYSSGHGQLLHVSDEDFTASENSHVKSGHKFMFVWLCLFQDLSLAALELASALLSFQH